MKKHVMKMLLAVLLLVGLIGMNVSAADEGDFRYQEVAGGVEITGYCGKNMNVVIPDKIDGKPVVSIGESAFYVDDIISVEIPATVTIIGKGAFKYCEKLKTVTFKGNSLQTIGYEAFDGCESLSNITFPASLKNIDKRAFANCNSLQTLDLSKYTITAIGEGAFVYCRNLAYISFPATINQISKGVCNGCEKLKTVVINGNNVKIIEDRAFGFCDALTTINIPASVHTIGDYVFYASDGLNSITIPTSVQQIGSNAFNSCGLQTVYCQYGSYAYNYFKKHSLVKIVASGTYLKQTSITIYVGDKKTLALANNNGGTTFTSSKKKVVSVSSKGVIKGLKKGTAIITAKNNGVVSKCKVIVKNRTLNYKKATITEGFSLKLKLSGTGTVKWSSSNKSIATVSSKGLVKAKQPGKVTITAKSKGKKYTCKITVARNEKSFTPYSGSYSNLDTYHEITKIYKSGSKYVVEVTYDNYAPYTVIGIHTLNINVYANGQLFLSKQVRDMDVEILPYKKKVVSFEFSGSEIRKKKVDLRTDSITKNLSNGVIWYVY